ncbi:MAG: hypothetical protein ACFB15_22565 [Cyclobacteriaceae bacterium]
MVKTKSIHITLLAGYYYLFAVILAMAGVIYLIASDWLLSVVPENDYFIQMTKSDFTLWGSIILIAAGLEALLATYLLKCSRIAQIIAILISALGLLWAIFGLIAYSEFLNIFFLGIHAYFLWVLTYRYQPSRSPVQKNASIYQERIS